MTFPHCDAQILHAPSECDICDKYASEAQEYRQAWGIAFTGHAPEPNQHPCPADVNRGPDNYNRWGGNTAKKGREVGWKGMYPYTEGEARADGWTEEQIESGARRFQISQEDFPEDMTPEEYQTHLIEDRGFTLATPIWTWRDRLRRFVNKL